MGPKSFTIPERRTRVATVRVHVGEWSKSRGEDKSPAGFADEKAAPSEAQVVRPEILYQIWRWGLFDPKRHRPTPRKGVTRKLDYEEKSQPRLEDKSSNKRAKQKGARQTRLPFKSSQKYRRPLQMKKKWGAPVKRKRRRYSKFGF